MLRPVKERPQGPAEGARTGCAMSWRQQASRSIQCRSCLGSVPLRCVLRPSRLPERNRHAGDFWRPKACLMTGLGQGEPDSSRIRRARGVLAIVLARGRSLGAIECERACTASPSRGECGCEISSCLALLSLATCIGIMMRLYYSSIPLPVALARRVRLQVQQPRTRSSRVPTDLPE